MNFEMKRLKDPTLTRVIQEYALEHHPVEVNEGAVIEFDTAKLYSYIASKYYEMGYNCKATETDTLIQKIGQENNEI